MKRPCLTSIILIGFCMAGCATTASTSESFRLSELVGHRSHELLAELGAPAQLIAGGDGTTWVYVLCSTPCDRQYLFFVDSSGRISSFDVKTAAEELPTPQPQVIIEPDLQAQGAQTGETEVALSGPEAKAGTLTKGNKEVIFHFGGEEKKAPSPPLPVAEKPRPPEVQVVERIVYKAVPVTKEVHADRYIFSTITFAEGSAELLPKAIFDEQKGEFLSGGTQIEQVAELIKRSGSDKVFVEGNIDSAEKLEYANFGRARAEAVAKALADFGVDPNALEVVDNEASKPLALSETEIGRALNRRVSFTVIPRGQSLEPETLVQPPAPEPDQNIKIVEKVVEKEVAAPLLVVTDRFIFPNILFDYDKADLTAEGLENTKKAAEALKTIQSLKKVIVAGNCDSRGSDAYNDELSMKRADSVKKELEKEGLNASMLEAVGNGERKPIASNDTPKGMAANRRVELEASY